LVIEADPLEVRLPSEWRLAWVSDGADLRPVSLDSALACGENTAQVKRVEGPSDPLELAANESVALFCSAIGSLSSTAWQVFELPGSTRGRVRAVSYDSVAAVAGLLPRMLVSNEVTLNGGVPESYPPVVLHSSSTHHSTQFVVRAIGLGLQSVVGAMVQAPDSLWSLPLEITEKSDSTLTAVAEVYASMPASVLRLTTTEGTLAVAPLPPDAPRAGIDPDFAALADSCDNNHCWYFDPDPEVYPKDFAFFYAIAPNPVRGLFHLFYIRNRRNTLADNTSRTFGHAWSRDLRNWSYDTSAAVFSVSTNAWDRSHVWAPSIVQVGPAYHMFYTGVDATNPDQGSYGNQRIGYATTAAIDTGHATVWMRRSQPTYTVTHTGWAWTDSINRRHQFRDPFIMADPDSAGRYLLFMVGEKQDGDYAVGVARNPPGTLNAWQDLGFYRSTERGYGGNRSVVESPMAFPDSAYPASKSASQAIWRVLFTDPGNPSPDSAMRFTTKTLNTLLADTTLTHWSTPSTNLFSYLNGDSTAWGTYATEYLRVVDVDFLATFNGDGIRVSRMRWNGTNFYLRRPPPVAVEGSPTRSEAGVALRLLQAKPGSGRLGFELGLPARERVRLGIYDVAGRRVRSLIDGEVPAGTINLEWDGRDETGNATRTGMYFAKLSGDFGSRVVRAALIR
jgi:glycosyl hydrolase family 32/flagellar hook capping protein FlgD